LYALDGREVGAMPRKATISYSQLRVGIVVTIALGIFLFTTLYTTREGGLPIFGGQFTVHSFVRDVNGLKAGAPVHLSGVEVGSVTSVEFSEPGAPLPVKVTIRLRREIEERVTTNSLLSVGSLGVLGEKMVDIDPGAPGGAPIGDGGVIAGEAGDPIKGIISDASTTMKEVRDLITTVQEGRGSLGKILKGEEFHDKLLEFVEKAQDLFTTLEGSEGTLGRLIRDPEIYENLNDLAAGLSDVARKLRDGEGGLGRLISDEKTGESLASLVDKLDTVSTRIAGGEGTLGALVNEREFYDKLSSVSANLDAITARLDRGDGTAGRLLHDRELYDNLNTTAGELRGLIKDIRENPKEYLRIKVSLF
jgi:phospholipid/cholesterol/gamma-HCH transport system substrate-binding protein